MPIIQKDIEREREIKRGWNERDRGRKSETEGEGTRGQEEGQRLQEDNMDALTTSEKSLPFKDALFSLAFSREMTIIAGMIGNIKIMTADTAPTTIKINTKMVS